MEEQNVEVGVLVDVSVPAKMDSPIDVSPPQKSSYSPEVTSRLADEMANKENADGTVDSIEIERSDDSDRRHSLTLSTPGALHHRILRDVTEKSTCCNTVSSPAVQMLEDEMFDFDFVLSPAVRSEEIQQNTEEEEEEVFIGPVGFAEKCVAQSLGPEIKPLSPLSAEQMAELVKEAALVAYRLKTDSKNSSSNDEGTPAKKRHSRSGTFTLDNSPLKLLSLPIIESEECDIDKPSIETKNKAISPDRKKGNTVTKGNKENLAQQGRKLQTPKGLKFKSGIQSPVNKAKKSLQGVFRTKEADKSSNSKVETKSKLAVSAAGSTKPVPTIKPALTNNRVEKQSGIRRLQPPKAGLAVKVSDTSSIKNPLNVSENRSSSTVTSTDKSLNTSSNRSIQPPKSRLAVKQSGSTVSNKYNSAMNKSLNTSKSQPVESSKMVKSSSVSGSKCQDSSVNRRSLNLASSAASNRSYTLSSSEIDGKSTASKGSNLNRSYTISEPSQKLAIPSQKKPAAKPSLLRPGEIQKKSLANHSNLKMSNGPVKATVPVRIQSNTVERKPSIRLPSSTSSMDMSMSTPVKVQKKVQPKLLSNNFSSPARSGNFNVSTSTPASSNKRRSFLPTPNTSRTSSVGSIPPASPLSYRSGSSTSSMSSVSDSPFTTGGRVPAGRPTTKKQSIGTYASIDEINENSPSALMPRKQRVVNTPNLPVKKVSAWSPIRKTQRMCLEDAVNQCTKRSSNR